MVINLSISNYKSKISHKTRDYLIVLLLASTVRPVIHLFLAISPIVSCATERSICASDITGYLPLQSFERSVRIVVPGDLLTFGFMASCHRCKFPSN